MLIKYWRFKWSNVHDFYFIKIYHEVCINTYFYILVESDFWFYFCLVEVFFIEYLFVTYRNYLALSKPNNSPYSKTTVEKGRWKYLVCINYNYRLKDLFITKLVLNLNWFYIKPYTLVCNTDEGLRVLLVCISQNLSSL